MSMEFLMMNLWGNPVQSYLLAFGFALLTFLVFKFIVSVGLRKFRSFAESTSNDFDDLLVAIANKLAWPLFFIILLLGVTTFFKLGEIYEQWLNYVVTILVVWQVIRCASYFVDYLMLKLAKRQKGSSQIYYTRIFSGMIKAVLWVIAIIIVLENLGYDVSSLVAGLGIGGIAIALAVQNILSDLFSSLSLYFDQPFKVDDYIIIGDLEGNVKKIGLKTTRITSLQGEEIVIPNNKLTSTEIRNMGKMKERRVKFMIGVEYDTSNSKMQKVCEIAEKAISAQENARFDRAHFKTFGEYSLDFEIVYYVTVPDYPSYMEVNHHINLSLKKALEAAKISIAYPTRRVLQA